MTRVLFVGETWHGSNARSLSEALARHPGVVLSDIGEDHFLPKYQRLAARVASRLLRTLHKRELADAILRAIDGFHPEVVLVYKGAGIQPALVERIRGMGLPVINVFPDCSPHPHGRDLREAMGLYDLVISTKPFHPQIWQTVYGYANRCAWVPHGYDPGIHYWAEPASSQSYDVALCCSWRPEYHRLMRAFAGVLNDDRIIVAVAGPRWSLHRDQFPHHWHFLGPREGRAYGIFLRSARIVIAPVNREMVVRGVRQPGDVDSARTYELAAAHCFFLHQRSDHVATVYDERNEVPLWNDPGELASLVRRWLPDESGRRSMAARAHARAVPAYSVSRRAASVLALVEEVLSGREASPSYERADVG